MTKIQCLECKKYFVRPLAHVWQKHQISGRDYKLIHGLDLKKGITTEEDREKMREHNITNSTIKNLQNGAKYRFKKGDKVGSYQRSQQTITRLKLHWQEVRKLGGALPTVEKIIITCAECGKEKAIYPRYKIAKNYCGIVCRNRGINNNKKQ